MRAMYSFTNRTKESLAECDILRVSISERRAKMESTKAVLKITEGADKGHTVVEIKSHWNTDHECQACGKDFSGNNAAIVILDNGNEALICSDCAEQL